MTDSYGWSPVLALDICQNIPEMSLSSLGTGEKVNKKTALQIHIAFWNLNFFPADTQTALTGTRCYLSNNPWVGILGSNGVQRSSFTLSWVFASFLKDIFLFLILNRTYSLLGGWSLINQLLLPWALQLKQRESWDNCLNYLGKTTNYPQCIEKFGVLQIE